MDQVVRIPGIERILQFMDDHTIELCVNRPGEYWLDKPGQSGMQRFEEPSITRELLNSLGRTIAGHSNTTFNHRNPLVSGVLPTGERVQIVAPPACVDDQFILAIRRQIVRHIPLSSYGEQNYWASTVAIADSGAFRREKMAHDPVFQAVQAGRIEEALIDAIKLQRSIVICGQMASGKTALATSLLQHLPQNERVGTIEDQRELDFSVPNVVRLLADEDSESYTGEKLIQACLRLRLDRIVVGELRGSLVEQYFRALMTSCKGGITTMHADDPYTAIEYLIQLWRTVHPNIEPRDVKRIIGNVIDLMVFIGYDGHQRRCDAVYFPIYDPALQEGGRA